MEETELILSNVVRFELPLYAGGDDLCSRLRSRWPGTKKRAISAWLVTARLRKDEGDLAVLLREVESYVADAGCTRSGISSTVAPTVSPHRRTPSLRCTRNTPRPARASRLRLAGPRTAAATRGLDQPG